MCKIFKQKEREKMAPAKSCINYIIFHGMAQQGNAEMSQSPGKEDLYFIEGRRGSLQLRPTERVEMGNET